MESDLSQVLFTAEEIRARVKQLAGEITAAYAEADSSLTLLPVLAGSMIFTADLIRELPVKMKIALVQLSAYPGKATTAGETQIRMDITGEIAGRHVLIVDDILDSGNTIRRVRQLVEERQPASVRTVVLLRKPGKAPPDVGVDFVGFDVADRFVVGYGLDFDDLYRNLSCIGVLRPELMP